MNEEGLVKKNILAFPNWKFSRQEKEIGDVAYFLGCKCQ